MSLYQVIFFKHLLSSDGHPFKCVQQKIAIRIAKNIDRAVEAAQRRYERLRHVRDWTLYADSFELEVDGKKIDYRTPAGASKCKTNLIRPKKQKNETKADHPSRLESVTAEGKYNV